MGILTIRLPSELHVRFNEECDKRDIRASELGRQAIELICQRMVDDGLSQKMSSDLRSHGIAGSLDGKRIDPKMLLPQEPKRLASPGVRGFAIDGGEITRDDQLEARRIATEKKKK